MSKNDLWKMVASAAHKKTTLPILTGVHVENEWASASNADVYVMAPARRMPNGFYDAKGFQRAEVFEAGELLSNLPHFADALQKGRGSELKFDLPEALRAVRHAVSSEETRYYLNGVFFDFAAGKGPALVATDGRVLAHLALNLSNPPPCGAFILPRKAVEILASFKGPGRWFLTENNGVVVFCEIDSGLVVAAKSIDGAYPNYSRVIPHADTPNGDIMGDVKGALNALKPFVRYSERSGTCLRVNGGTLSMQRADFEPLQGEWPTATIGEVPEFGVNIRYLKGALEAIRDGAFRLGISDASSPLLLESVAHPDLTQVIMPLRI